MLTVEQLKRRLDLFDPKAIVLIEDWEGNLREMRTVRHTGVSKALIGVSLDPAIIHLYKGAVVWASQIKAEEEDHEMLEMRKRIDHRRPRLE